MASIEARTGGRERLLDAARQLFVTGSYVEVSVGQVLEKAGVQAPSLYHHFGDKEGLFVAWAVDALERTGSRLSSSNVGEAPLRPQLLRIALALVSADDINLLVALRDAKHLIRPESSESIMAAYFRHVFEPVCAALVRGLQDGQLRPGPIDRLGHLFITTCCAFSSAYGRGGQDPNELAPWLVDAFLDGVGA